MEKYSVFRGWYRKSLSKPSSVWHRVYRVDSVLNNCCEAHTLCGRQIITTECDFDEKPDHPCFLCEKSTGITIASGVKSLVVETGRRFVPVGMTQIRTKASAIAELKRLLKPRTYYVWLHGIYGLKITAEWMSDTSLDIETETEIMTKKRPKNAMTFEEVQTHLDNFKAKINCICMEITSMASRDKKKKKLKGRLTECEDDAYFQELCSKAEYS